METNRVTKISCSHGNQGYKFCIDQCSNKSAMCLQKDCQCRKGHKDCLAFVDIDAILNIIQVQSVGWKQSFSYLFDLFEEVQKNFVLLKGRTLQIIDDSDQHLSKEIRTFHEFIDRGESDRIYPRLITDIIAQIHKKKNERSKDTKKEIIQKAVGAVRESIQRSMKGLLEVLEGAMNEVVENMGETPGAVGDKKCLERDQMSQIGLEKKEDGLYRSIVIPPFNPLKVDEKNGDTQNCEMKPEQCGDRDQMEQEKDDLMNSFFYIPRTGPIRKVEETVEGIHVESKRQPILEQSLEESSEYSETHFQMIKSNIKMENSCSTSTHTHIQSITPTQSSEMIEEKERRQSENLSSPHITEGNDSEEPRPCSKTVSCLKQSEEKQETILLPVEVQSEKVETEPNEQESCCQAPRNKKSEKRKRNKEKKRNEKASRKEELVRERHNTEGPQTH